VRFVDEFRDAELGRAVAAEILSRVQPGLRRAHPLDLQIRRRRPAAG
jgi:hypothetical protein